MMSTNSTISLLEPDGSVKSIYCHWDGYPSHNGKMLYEHYNSEALARKLIALGNISSLYESCDLVEGHTFDNPIEGYTVAYHRDRGEDLDIWTAPALNELEWESYNYLWDVD
jgi:hypothetical protein